MNELVNEFYKRKIEEEEKYVKNGPLKRVIYKDKCYGSSTQYGVVNDYAGDNLYAIDESDTILHKYSNRLLVLVTSKCICECAYCFRQVNRRTNISEVAIEKITDNVIDYVNNHKEVKEVIISGGDPIILGAKKLSYFLEKISKETHIRDFRLHTRSIVHSPDIITKEIIELLAKYDVRLVFHIVHPYEICTYVEDKIKEIQKKGIRCYNQFPLLRGINDNVKVIASLLYLLDNNRIRNLTIFITDPLIDIEEYRVSIRRSYEIWAELEMNYPAWLNATKMVFDSSIGKIAIKDMIELDEEKQGYWFRRGEKKIFFPDIPEEIDEAGDLNSMLWKDKGDKIQ